MRWLKSLVIVLGLFIVAALVALGYGFYKKATNPDWKLFGPDQAPAAAEAPASAPAPVISPAPATGKPKREPLKPFGTISLNLPAGCVIEEIKPRRRYSYFIIGPTPECNQVILVDMKEAKVLGSVKPRP